MNLEVFNKLKERVNKDLNITDMNVLEMTTRSTKLYTHYLDMYCRQLNEYKNLKVDQDEIYGRVYKKFKEDYNYELKISEIEVYCKADKDYSEIRRKVDFQGIVVDYLENVLKELNAIGYKIKSHIELKIFLAGGK